MRLGKIYTTFIKSSIQEGDKITKLPTTYDIYFLPMLRYLNHGKDNRMIQFRWIIWGINFRLNK